MKIRFSHRLVLIFFVIFAIALVLFFVFHEKLETKHKPLTQPSVITPITTSENLKSLSTSSLTEAETEMTSFIQLNPDETLIDTLTVDFDSDLRDDQVNLIKKVTSPYLYLIVGLYNPETGVYERNIELQTNITQSYSFSYACLDVFGKHRLSLVYQGVSDDGNSILKIYNLVKSILDGQKKTELVLVGDFKSDGNIIIEQDVREQSYELYRVPGKPFPVIVFGSDIEATEKNYDQYQFNYEWDSQENSFVLKSRTKLSESRIIANELAKIQDGTVKTFTNFLDGLWYKTSNDSSGIRYLFFDTENSEVILQFNNSEEVYSWLESHLINSGIYISTVNETISNLNRRYYISVVALDEIRLRIQENLGMTINEANLWDGNYKKMTAKSTLVNHEKEISTESFVNDLTSSTWISADGTVFSFSNGNYKISSDTIKETGKYAFVDIANSTVLTFRSSSETSFFKNPCHLSYALVAQPSKSKKTQKPTMTVDHNTIKFQPVTILAESFLQIDAPPLTLTKNKIEDKKE